MEKTGKNLRGGRQLPLQQGLISEMRMQGTDKDARQRDPEERQQTVGTVKVWSVVD
jgi:hypothetical protein